MVRDGETRINGPARAIGPEMGPAVCLGLLLFARIRQELREERKEETRARLGKAEKKSNRRTEHDKTERRGERTTSGQRAEKANGGT